MGIIDERPIEELEEFILFAVTVAGKTAYQVAKALPMFLSLEEGDSPFEKIRCMISKRSLMRNLKKARLGNYRKLNRAFRELVKSDIDLRTCSVQDLESFHGIGPKTARYFILHTRENADVAALDVHILRWLRERGYDAPKNTPTGKRYVELEKAFLKEARKRHLSPAELDLRIWWSSTKSGIPSHHEKQKEAYGI